MPGLELGIAFLPESREQANAASFVVLRIEPARHEFTLAMASATGQSFSLPGWGEKERLRAGINAGMYLPDKLTNTGYMRNGASINNDKQGGRLGAFFVAGRRNSKLPRVDILDRDHPGWQKRIEDYDIVAQNYRLQNSTGDLLWPEGNSRHSIAVIAKDGSGRILFILSQQPLTVQDFVRHLKELSLDCKTVMYVEGGRQAGLFIRLDAKEGDTPAQNLPGATAHPVPGGVIQVWKGQQSLLKLPGSPDALLPNVIGIKMMP